MWPNKSTPARHLEKKTTDSNNFLPMGRFHTAEYTAHKQETQNHPKARQQAIERPLQGVSKSASEGVKFHLFSNFCQKYGLPKGYNPLYSAASLSCCSTPRDHFEVSAWFEYMVDTNTLDEAAHWRDPTYRPPTR